MKINIHDLRVPVRLGCTAEERAYPQIVSFQLNLALASDKSLSSDALEDTVDYMAVVSTVKECCMSGEYKLLEHLAKRCGDSILELSGVVSSVNIEVEKQIVPETSGISFSCEITR